MAGMCVVSQLFLLMYKEDIFKKSELVGLNIKSKRMINLRCAQNSTGSRKWVAVTRPSGASEQEQRRMWIR